MFFKSHARISDRSRKSALAGMATTAVAAVFAFSIAGAHAVDANAEISAGSWGTADVYNTPAVTEAVNVTLNDGTDLAVYCGKVGEYVRDTAVWFEINGGWVSAADVHMWTPPQLCDGAPESDRAALEAVTVHAQPAVPVAPSGGSGGSGSNGSGSTGGSGAYSAACVALLRNAGVDDIPNAQWLIQRESQCNTYAVNPSSGACGIAQELPCGKSGCSWGAGQCQVIWMNKYVHERYGSWANAVYFSQQHGYYNIPSAP